MNKKIKNAKVTEYNGIKFKSKLEFSVAECLKELGMKYEYEQRKFILQPSFKYNNETIRQISYTPDFIINDNIIIECKGFPSDSWKIKRKLFMHLLKNKHPEYFYFEIYSIKDLMNIIDMDDRFFAYKIVVKDLKDNFVGEYNSISEAVELLNLNEASKGNIISCILNKRNKAFGYKWQRVEDVFTPLEGEIWKDVVGFEGLYYVSNFGRIASAQFHGIKQFKIMSQSKNQRDYCFVKLRNWKEGIEGSYFVHRLVAEAFLENPKNKPQVDHIDTNPSNNNVDNLKWVTNLENQRNPITNAKLKHNMKEMNKASIGPKASAKKRSKKVIYTDENGISHSFTSLTDAYKNTGKYPSSIDRWCKKELYGWKYDSNRNDETNV